jgi:hypothetical protein
MVDVVDDFPKRRKSRTTVCFVIFLLILLKNFLVINDHLIASSSRSFRRSLVEQIENIFFE